MLSSWPWLPSYRCDCGWCRGTSLRHPGGRRDAADRNPEETALRETEEEVGIERGQIDLVVRSTISLQDIQDFIQSKLDEYAAGTLTGSVT